MIDPLFRALPLAIVSSTPLLLAVEGELIVQQSGIINLGVEGMLLVAALTSAVTAQATMNAAAGFIAGVAGALLVALLFGLFVIHRKSDQIVTGTAVNLFALGATGTAHRFLQKAPAFAGFPRLQVDPLPALAWIVIPLVLGVLLWQTSFGLRLRGCGENPAAIKTAGGHPRRYQWVALAIEAALAGFGGAYLSLALSSGFTENMTAGRGFVALSIVIFGRWKVKGAVGGTALFGVVAAIQYALQAMNHGIPFHLLLALPYVITLLLLTGVAGRSKAPQALGK